MPRSISNLELKQLSTVGGRGGRLSVRRNESLWSFNHRTTMITPSSKDVNGSEDVNVDVAMKCESDDSETDDSYDDGYKSSSSDESLVDSETNDPVAPPMTGHRLLHLPSLACAMTDDMCCRRCCDDSWNDFLGFCDTEIERTVAATQQDVPPKVAKILKRLMKLVNVRVMYKKWKGIHQMNNNTLGKLTIREESHGFGTTLFLNCMKNHQFSIKAQETVKNGHGNNAVCKYDLNLRYTLGLQMIGVGGEHAATVAAFLDFPYPHKWKADFPLLEQYMHCTIDEIKVESEHDATMAEIEKNNRFTYLSHRATLFRKRHTNAQNCCLI